MPDNPAFDLTAESAQSKPASEYAASEYAVAGEGTFTDGFPVDSVPVDSVPVDGAAYPHLTYVHTRTTGLDLAESFAFVFTSRDWAINLVIGFVCMLIPQIFTIAGLVALIVYWGYAFQIVESRIRYPGSIYPTFNVRETGGYMHRAVFPFLLTLPFWLWWSVQFMFWYMSMVFSILLLADPNQADETRAYVAIGIPTVILLALVCGYVLQLFLVPMILRAGLTRNFREAFRLRWILSFVQRTWLPQLAVFVFMFSMTWLLAITGGLLGCVGLFAAQAWSLLAFMHLSWQVYDIFLHRGGTPIELHEPQVTQPVVAAASVDQLPVGEIVP